ncbi:helix-turn-helix domain-containing protein [Propionivibrio dicarboxylicus]|uniref:helix-turn-helix domain-containing protein n=1 Tax=Propionivibrio dicarboxylicus TaxID=83767 RepID=UPI003CCBB9D2
MSRRARRSETPGSCLSGGGVVNTFTLQEAAGFLKMHPEEVRRRAKAGLIPGAKAGRAWVFLEEDLADWLRSKYSGPRPFPKVSLNDEVQGCHSTSVDQSIGSMLSHPMVSEYASLLGLKSSRRPENSTTS